MSRFYAASAMAGEVESGIQNLYALAQANPDASEPWEELGRLYHLAEDDQSAINYYSEARELNPTSLDTLLALSYLYAWEGEVEDSFRAAREALHYHPWIDLASLPNYSQVASIDPARLATILAEPLSLGRLSEYAVWTPEAPSPEWVIRERALVEPIYQPYYTYPLPTTVYYVDYPEPEVNRRSVNLGGLFSGILQNFLPEPKSRPRRRLPGTPAMGRPLDLGRMSRPEGRGGDSSRSPADRSGRASQAPVTPLQGRQAGGASRRPNSQGASASPASPVPPARQERAGVAPPPGRGGESQTAPQERLLNQNPEATVTIQPFTQGRAELEQLIGSLETATPLANPVATRPSPAPAPGPGSTPAARPTPPPLSPGAPPGVSRQEDNSRERRPAPPAPGEPSAPSRREPASPPPLGTPSAPPPRPVVAEAT
ncbi:MAG: hypothetical protein LBU79_05920, partial [Planctomycetota bacterium]|nr:hypothetical protein [Planctomycetota bacterium]